MTLSVNQQLGRIPVRQREFGDALIRQRVVVVLDGYILRAGGPCFIRCIHTVVVVEGAKLSFSGGTLWPVVLLSVKNQLMALDVRIFVEQFSIEELP